MSKSKKDKKPKKVGKKEAKAGTFSPSPAPGITDQAEASESPEPTDRHAIWRAKQDAEVAAQWAHLAASATKAVDRAKTLIEERVMTIDYGLSGPSEPEQSEYERLSADPNVLSIETINGEIIAVEYKPEKPEETSGKDVPTPPAAPEGIGLEPAADPVLVNGNGQAMIHYLDPVTGAEKVKGYTRVTTYIDGLDDKTVLTKWKMRTLLEGAAIDDRETYEDAFSDRETRISTVGRAIKRLDEALKDIDQREKVEGELLELRRQELLKEHRTLLEGIAEELMELGGAHEKANKGTDLHRLTELVDNGHPLPDDVTASDRRDVEAYSAKMTELGITTVWTERRVVLDDIQVSGTMDRAYQVRLPGMQRRIRVVGDLKTGSVSWGAGKIGMQLALYARGLGYDWTKPLERERLNLSKAHGLLVHLPQGEGVCEVYLVDLELAAQGLVLAKQVREWRNTSKRVYDLKSPLRVPEVTG